LMAPMRATPSPTRWPTPCARHGIVPRTTLRYERLGLASGPAFSIGILPASRQIERPFGPDSCGCTPPTLVELAGDVGSGAFQLIGEADAVLAPGRGAECPSGNGVSCRYSRASPTACRVTDAQTGIALSCRVAYTTRLIDLAASRDRCGGHDGL
jgi:hypothetical protein